MAKKKNRPAPTASFSSIGLSDAAVDELAERIAVDLFAGGNRLVVEKEGQKLSGSGWCLTAAKDRVRMALVSAESKLTDEIETLKARAQVTEDSARQIDALKTALQHLVGRALYVGAHRFGAADPVGTRIVAIEDLKTEAQRAVDALQSLNISAEHSPKHD